jgi:zinc transporter 1/2/3
MLHIKFFMAVMILFMAVLAGLWPFRIKIKHQGVASSSLQFPQGEAIACGVFLGAGLIHMLGDSAQGFISAGYQYPFAFLIAGAIFLVFLLIEHWGRELQAHRAAHSSGMAILATCMLSIHSLFEGAALGISGSLLTALVLGLAIIAHKWAASFSLALQINKSALSFRAGMACFLIFACMTPLGILLGGWVHAATGSYPLLTPIFSALAAGTFLYIGTLHGLSRATMIQHCCNMREFVFLVLGFSIMAVVAIWT